MKLELSPTIILNVQFQNMHVYTSMVFTSTVYFIMHQNISWYGHMQYLCKTHLFYARIGKMLMVRERTTKLRVPPSRVRTLKKLSSFDINSPSFSPPTFPLQIARRKQTWTSAVFPCSSPVSSSAWSSLLPSQHYLLF